MMRLIRRLMLNLIGGLVAMLASCFAIGAVDSTAMKPLLLIGITENRGPFVYVNNQQVADGILIQTLNTLCQQIEYNCVYEPGEFYPLLEELQIGGVQALMVIDDAILPEVDEVLLSKPLCQMKPVFVQLEDGKKQSTKERQYFEGKKLGVLSGSMMHLNLMDNYSEFASIHPYQLLESGAFDLVFGRIDSLYTTEAFYEDKIKGQNLVSPFYPQKKFEAITLKTPEDFPTSMRLALPGTETTLLTKFDEAITQQQMGKPCASLLAAKKKTLSLINNSSR